jgi:hypothetical protein
MFYQEDICWCNQNQGSPYTIINRQHGVTRKVSYDSLMRSSQAVPAHLERERERERERDLFPKTRVVPQQERSTELGT